MYHEFYSLLYKELLQTIKANTEENGLFTKEIQITNQHMENIIPHQQF